MLLKHLSKELFTPFPSVQSQWGQWYTCVIVLRLSGDYDLDQRYRVSQKFVPLISCTITFYQNFIFTSNFQQMFISLSSTCIQNFSNWHALFFFLYHNLQSLRHEVGLRVDPEMIHSEHFYHLLRRSQCSPQTIFVQFRQLKNKNSLGIHPKKTIIPAPFHSKAFVLLYKFETSWALLIRLSRVMGHVRGL